MCSLFDVRTVTVRGRGVARRGVSIVLTVTLLTLLIAFVSLAVDFGRIRLARAELQTAADASALAGASQLPLTSQAVIDEALSAAAQNNVIDNHQTHNSRINPGVDLQAADDVTLGIWNPAFKTFTPLQDNGSTEQDERRFANAVRTDARRLAERNNPVKLIFAPIVGAFTNDIECHAIAYITGGAKKFGFVGIDSVSSNGNYAMIDSAVYGQNAVGGGIASNGDINLGNGDVYGDARAGGNLIQKNNSLVTGWTAKLDYELDYPPDAYNPPIPLTNTPAGISPGILLDGTTFNAGGNNNGKINAGTYRFSQWTQSGSGTITVNGPATIYIDGDFKMTGSGTLKIDGSKGPVKFYINGNFTQTGGNIVNTGSASDLSISMTGSGTTFDYKGTVATAAHVYAPLSNVKINGTPGFTGWIIGKKLDFWGTSILHYDESLTSQEKFKLRLVK